MKTCTVCKLEKSKIAFSKLHSSQDGLQFKCRDCQREYYSKYINRPGKRANATKRVMKYLKSERGQATRRAYLESDHCKEVRRAFRQTPTGIALRKREQARLSKLKRHLVYSPVRRKLKKQPCEVCGKFPAQAHHHDYSKPLDVNWLCTRHHADKHMELTA